MCILCNKTEQFVPSLYPRNVAGEQCLWPKLLVQIHSAIHENLALKSANTSQHYLLGCANMQ